jgi:hypothetical protein
MRDTYTEIQRAHKYNYYAEASCQDDVDEEDSIFDQQCIRENHSESRKSSWWKERQEKG